MASGGGNRPTNLSFSLPPAFSSSPSLPSTLQTPDTNSLFISSLGGSGGSAGKDAPSGMLGNVSPNVAGSHPFSSLEELLNVTGINSPGLEGLGSVGGGGVDSLQQLAKEVENKQQRELQPPAAKRPHLDLQAPPPQTQPHPPTIPQQLPSNIRVQPLTFSSSSQLPPPSVTIASLLNKKPSPVTDVTSLPPPPRTLPSPQVASVAPMVPSLFSSIRHQPPSSLGQLQPPVSSPQSSESSSLVTMSTNFSGPTSLITSSGQTAASVPSLSSSFSFTANSNPLFQHSFPTLPVPTSTSLAPPLRAPLPPLGFPPQLPPPTTVSSTVGNASFPLLPPTLPLGQTIPSSSSLSSIAAAHSFSSAAPPTSLTPPGGQQLSLGVGNIPASTSMVSTATSSSVSTTTAAISPILSGPNPLVQLIQLYKQFHSQGDQQGMLKIKQQLNILIARQKIIAAQNTLRAAQSGLIAHPTVGNVAGAPAITATSASQSLSARPDQSQVTSSSMTLGQASQPLQARQPTQQTGGNLSLPPNFATGQPKCEQLPSSVPQPMSSMLSAPLTTISGGGQPLTNPSVGVASVMPLSSSSLSQPPFSIPLLPAAPSTSTALPQPMQLQQPGPPASQQQQLPASRAQEQAASQSLQQQIVKRLQTVIASLPESQRPKSLPELKDFVQKYSSLITQNSLLDVPVGGGGKFSPTSIPSSSMPTFVAPKASPSSSVTVTTLKPAQSGGSIPSLLNSSIPLAVSGGAKLSHPPSEPSFAAGPLLSSANAPTQINSVTSQSPSAQVAEHFKSSLAALSVSKVATVGGVMAAVPSVVPPSLGLTPQRSASGAVSVAATVHAPITTQFSQKPAAVNSLLPTSQSNGKLLMSSVMTSSQAPPTVPPTSTTTTTPSTTSSSAQQSAPGIQPGVATPLPPGLTLETLGVLCRLPETDLMKLKLPAVLLSAIKFWKARQPPGRSVARTSSAANRNNIPVLTAAGPPSSAAASNRAAGAQSQAPPSTAASGVSPFSGKVGSAAQSKNLQTGQMNKASTSSQGAQLQQPMVIPNSAGFPPRSLHAFIPGLPQTSLPQKSSSSTPSAHRHQTRYKAKVEQQKAENERMQALAKVLQSSEEARIAFRFSAHLDKMHTQLLSPDTVTPFRSHHDILARLLPYHVFAEPEPPPAAVEKADAVFESVAQVLLSRSRGLTSRFQQIVSKSDAEGGPEQLAMKMHLEKLFIEGEQERIRQENIEKEQAEQVAADLSLMADGVDAFEPDFSLGDAFCPLMDMSDTGIT